jgi:hypothetical protein
MIVMLPNLSRGETLFSPRKRFSTGKKLSTGKLDKCQEKYYCAAMRFAVSAAHAIISWNLWKVDKR